MLRDLPLLREVAARTEVTANLSVPTLDEKAWRASEPHTPHPRARLEAVAELNRAGIPTGILVAPLMPGINDDPRAGRADPRAIAAEAGATSVGGIALHLRGEVRGDLLRVAALLPARPRGALRGAVPARRVRAAGGAPAALGAAAPPDRLGAAAALAPAARHAPRRRTGRARATRAAAGAGRPRPDGARRDGRPGGATRRDRRRSF